MAKSKERIRAYNKEYFARPEVKERAKIRNAKYRKRRAEYKKTERGKEANRKYEQSEAGKRAIKNKGLKYKYGITIDEYELMVEQQEGKCKICDIEADLHVDHNHTTGEVRGLLCGNCNRGIGLFKERQAYLERAVEYLIGV